MRVLVTGHLGYIGSVLTSVLRHARFDVLGLDCDWFRGCDFGRTRETVSSFDSDVRDIEFTDLLSFDAVVHLAAMSDDAMGALNPTLVREINHDATVRLAECCKKAHVQRFLFASSCSVYGRGGCEVLDEKSPVCPLGAYAEAKLDSERALARLADSTFSPVLLRNATVYGVSPKLRTDLVVNDFAGSAVTTGQVNMRTAGSAWRPLIHVEDLARAYAAVLTAPTQKIHNEVFNVAVPGENYHVIDVADAVSESIPDCTRSSAGDALDQRSYRVDGSKLLDAFPQLGYRWRLATGIRQLGNALSSAGFTAADWRCNRYRRLPRLQALLERGDVTPDLRIPRPAMA